MSTAMVVGGLIGLVGGVGNILLAMRVERRTNKTRALVVWLLGLAPILSVAWLAGVVIS